jgi:TolB-like protein
LFPRVDGDTNPPVWAHTSDRALDDVLPLQAEVATAIAQQVNATVAR